MKIKKEFISHILSGEKQHEYRVVDKNKKGVHEGIYKINNTIYLLKYKYEFENFDELISHCSDNREGESLRFILNKRGFDDYFLKSNEVFALYKGEKIEMKELEIVE